MKIKFLTAIIMAATLSTGAHAASYSTTLNWASNSSYTEQSGGNVFGTNIVSGDTFSVTHQTIGANNWVSNGGSAWFAIGASDGGTRIGDATYNFYNNGSLVLTSSDIGQSSGSAHIGQHASSSVGLIFNKVVWSFILSTSTANTNILDTNFITSFNDNLEYNVVNAVPIPAAAFMFAPALLGFMGLRRRAKNKAV